MAKNENEERKQNTGFEIVIGLILPIMTTLIEIVSFQHKILCIILGVSFVILLFAILCYQIFSYTGRIEEKVKKAYKEYEDSLSKGEFKTYSSADDIRAAIRESKNGFSKEYRQDKMSFVYKVIGCIAALIFCIVLVFVRLAVTSEDGGVDNPVTADDAPVVININTVGEENNNDDITPEQKAEMENKTMILTDPNRLKTLSNEEKEEIFYVSDTDRDTVEKEVKDHNEKIFSRNIKSNILPGSIVENFVVTLQEQEDAFLLRQSKARIYKSLGDYKNWLSTIPNSETMDKIIDAREGLWEPLYEDKEFSGTLCMKLANNMQLYAAEYMLQGGRPETVVYYEAQAIKWAERGLEYGDLPAHYYAKYYNYIKARYQDISDYIENNLERFGSGKDDYQQIKVKAYAIYEAM